MTQVITYAVSPRIVQTSHINVAPYFADPMISHITTKDNQAAALSQTG
jgi:hypothetical protein